MEEYAYILDYLPQGIQGGGFGKKEPICYALGDEEFKLFELVPKADATVVIGVRTFIGKDTATVKRDVIDHVKRRVPYDDLTNNAMTELEYAVAEIVMAKEDRFIRFFNEAESISMRKHLLEELPGLGKKSMTAILDERKKENFKDFADLSARTGIKNPEKLIAARIILEIKDKDRKRYLFVTK
jgi:putative nucleotide binding protein